jgi:hypothetical protein
VSDGKKTTSPSSGDGGTPAVCTTVPCQLGNLVVHVRKDTASGSAISGAAVNISGPETSSGTSDAADKVEFNKITPGSYKVTARKDFHTPDPASDTVVVPAGGTKEVTLVLKPIVCRFSILGPPDVPGLSKYKYKIDVPAGKTPTNITWTVDKPTAGFEGATDKAEVIVTFQNTKADWIKLKATFKLDGKDECAEKQVALVKVEVGAATFTNPGKVSSVNVNQVCLVNPPAPPTVQKWITTNDPGSDIAKFTHNGTNQPPESVNKVVSNGGGGGVAYKAVTIVKLISPPENPAALQRIQVGYIQHASISGSAMYATSPAGGTRTATTPTSDSVDWLGSPSAVGATDEWPWYDQSARQTGPGNSTWSTTLTLTDSPALGFPAKYNPNDATNPNSAKPLSTANGTFSFIIRVGVRTLDADLGADKHYFDEGNSTWKVNFVWPLVPGVSIVTTGAAWTTPRSPNEVNVNVVPSSILLNAPFLRWIP